MEDLAYLMCSSTIVGFLLAKNINFFFTSPHIVEKDLKWFQVSFHASHYNPFSSGKLKKGITGLSQTCEALIYVSQMRKRPTSPWRLDSYNITADPWTVSTSYFLSKSTFDSLRTAYMIIYFLNSAGEDDIIVLSFSNRMLSTMCHYSTFGARRTLIPAHLKALSVKSNLSATIYVDDLITLASKRCSIRTMLWSYFLRKCFRS